MNKGFLFYSVAIVAHLAALLTSVALCYMYATTYWEENQGKLMDSKMENVKESLNSFSKHFCFVNGGMFYYEEEKICYAVFGDGYAWKWDAAREHCMEHQGTYGDLKNGDLAAISSWKISNYLRGVLKRDIIGQGLWIGAYKVDGQWEWSNGDTWQFTNWGRNEPNSDQSSGENFVRANVNLEWQDWINTNSWFLCEWKL